MIWKTDVPIHNICSMLKNPNYLMALCIVLHWKQWKLSDVSTWVQESRKGRKTIINQPTINWRIQIISIYLNNVLQLKQYRVKMTITPQVYNFFQLRWFHCYGTNISVSPIDSIQILLNKLVCMQVLIKISSKFITYKVLQRSVVDTS